MHKGQQQRSAPEVRSTRTTAAISGNPTRTRSRRRPTGPRLRRQRRSRPLQPPFPLAPARPGLPGWLLRALALMSARACAIDRLARVDCAASPRSEPLELAPQTRRRAAACPAEHSAQLPPPARRAPSMPPRRRATAPIARRAPPGERSMSHPARQAPQSRASACRAPSAGSDWIGTAASRLAASTVSSPGTSTDSDRLRSDDARIEPRPAAVLARKVRQRAAPPAVGDPPQFDPPRRIRAAWQVPKPA